MFDGNLALKEKVYEIDDKTLQICRDTLLKNGKLSESFLMRKLSCSYLMAMHILEVFARTK